MRKTRIRNNVNDNFSKTGTINVFFYNNNNDDDDNNNKIKKIQSVRKKHFQKHFAIVFIHQNHPMKKAVVVAMVAVAVAVGVSDTDIKTLKNDSKDSINGILFQQTTNGTL